MINWTLTEGVEHPDAPGEVFWEVNGVGADPNSPHQDPHDPRHFPKRVAALAFLLTKMKRGDTLHIAGADTGRVLRVGYVLTGDKIVFDVGTRTIDDPYSLVGWLDSMVKPGDTVAYLPFDT